MYIKGADEPPAPGGEIYNGPLGDHDGAYSLMVKLRSVAAAIRVQFPLGTLPLMGNRTSTISNSLHLQYMAMTHL